VKGENCGGGHLILDEEGSHEPPNVLERRQELMLDRRERRGRQATHFSVPSNKSRYDGQRGQKGRHAAAATHWRRLVVSDPMWASVGLSRVGSRSNVE